MDSKESNVGSFTVAAGTPKERIVAINNRFVCQFADNRVITIGKLSGGEGYAMVIENIVSSGRETQSIMWLSEVSFKAMCAAMNFYTVAASINYESCIDELVGSKHFNYIFEGDGLIDPFENKTNS